MICRIGSPWRAVALRESCSRELTRVSSSGHPVVPLPRAAVPIFNLVGLALLLSPESTIEPSTATLVVLQQGHFIHHIVCAVSDVVDADSEVRA